jgi:hypothetical protein
MIDHPLTTGWLHSTACHLRLLCGLLLFAAATASNPVDARPSSDDACAFTDGDWDLCKKSERKKQREAFGLPSIAVYRGLESQAVRVFEDNANGWPRFALVFYEDRNRVPMVEIRRPLNPDGTSRRPALVARLDPKDWRTVVAKQQLLQTPYVETEVCTDGFTRTIEAIDDKGQVTTRVEHSCGENPVNTYFLYLTQLAVDQFDHCRAIETRWDIKEGQDKLVYCTGFDGNKMAAAELFNQLKAEEFNCCRSITNLTEIVHLFDDDIVFAWPGQSIATTAEAAAKLWLEKEPDIMNYIGETSDQVRAEGRIKLATDENSETTETISAPFASVWKKGPDGQFRMQNFLVMSDLTINERSRTLQLGEVVEIPAAPRSDN